MNGIHLVTVIIDLAAPPLWAVFWWGVIRPREFFRLPLAWFCMAAGCMLTAVASGNWLATASCGVNMLIALGIWWWNRRGRKAAKLLGAKSRALRDALVRRVREVATPRPVLRPVPDGAGV